MAKSNDCFTVDGEVIDVLKSGRFKIKLENGAITTGVLSGKMRMNSIRIVNGDKVTVEISPYDLNTSRIVYRN